MKARLIFAVLVWFYGVRGAIKPPLGPYTTPWLRFRFAVWQRIQAAYAETGLPLLWWQLQRQNDIATRANAGTVMRVDQQQEGGAK